MNVQAILSEPAEMSASGASQNEGQAADEAEFAELLSQASTQEEEARGDTEEAGTGEAGSQSPTGLAAEADIAQRMPELGVLPGVGELTPDLPRSVVESVQNPSAPRLSMSALQVAEAGRPAQTTTPPESPGQGLPENLQEGLRQTARSEPASAASASMLAETAAAPTEPPPGMVASQTPPPSETSAVPTASELAAPAVSEAAVAELPVTRRPAAESADRVLPPTGQVAPDLHLRATDGETTTGSDGGAQDAALRGQANQPETGTRLSTAGGGEFAAVLEARDEGRPAPASAVPLAPVATTTATTAAAPPAVASPFSRAGTPEEVLPVHVEWLAARQGGNARISLHPPELGELELMVKVRGSAVDIVIRAQEPAAQMAAAQSRDLLADALTTRDLRIDQFDVRGPQTDLGDDDSPSQTNAQAREEASTRANGEKREGRDERSGSQEPGSSDTIERATTLATPPPAIDVHTAVDLRA